MPSESPDPHICISVVIPVFNGSRHLAAQLDSLVFERNGSNTPPFEVLIVDNGSSDDSTAVAAAFSDRLVIQLLDASDLRGQAHARNFGAAAAKAERILFLDQDDVVAPGYIAAMHRALDTEVLVAARMDRSFLNHGWRREVRELAQETGLGNNGKRHGSWAYGCTIGTRRVTFEVHPSSRHLTRGTWGLVTLTRHPGEVQNRSSPDTRHPSPAA